MDDDLRRSLFDPEDAHLLVLARRPAAGSAVTCVVSDVVWGEVVGLLRWSAAGTGTTALDDGRWWRLASGCADLLRRLPALGDEAGEPYVSLDPGAETAQTVGERVEQAGDRLAALLWATDPVPLRRLAGAVDALGAAAVSALAERATLPPPPGARG